MFIITEGIRNLLHSRTTSVFAVIVITISLIIGGWFFIVNVKVQEAVRYLESGMEVELFLEDSLGEDAVNIINTLLTKNPSILSVTYVSKDSAAAIFSKEVGKNISTLFGDYPLPASFRIRLNPAVIYPGAIDSIIIHLKSILGVTDIVEQRAYLLKLAHYRTVIWTLHLIIIIIVFGIAFILLINTTRLSILSRRKLIEILLLVGAREGVIMGPFLVEGFFLGLISGLLSIGFTYGLLWVLNEIVLLYLKVSWYIYLGEIVAGCVIGVFGNFFALRRYIRKL